MRPVATGDEDRSEAAPSARRRRTDEPDVLLDVPQLGVDEISLDVEDLKARVSLQADVLELLNLHVGVEAELGRVQLTIKGVEAQVLLKVHLDNVAGILDRVLTTIDHNPEIVEQLAGQLGGGVDDAGAPALEALGEIGAGAKAAGRPQRPTPPTTEARPRRSRPTAPTANRSRKTSRKWRKGGPKAR